MKKTTVNVPPVLRYQKHRRGCPCLSCDEARAERHARIWSAVGNWLIILFMIALAVTIVAQLWMAHPLIHMDCRNGC